LDPNGEYVRDWNLAMLPNLGSRLTIVAGMWDGSQIGRRTLPGDAESNGYTRSQWEIVIVSNPPDSLIALSKQFGGGETYTETSSPSEGMLMVMSSPIPFARSTFVAAGASDVYVGSNDSFEIHEFGSDGSLSRIIRRVDVPQVPVSDAAIEWSIEAREATMENPRVLSSSPTSTSIREGVLKLPRVASLPTFSGLQSDMSGNLWVKNYLYPWIDERPEAWTVFNSDGFLHAWVEHPEGLQIHEVGEDYVLGVVTDELGVERVRLYDLVRSN
jgi:hypothetical protein